MARRPAKPRVIPQYLYTSLEDCEDPGNDTKGLHLAQAKTWPPRRTNAGEPDPYIGCVCARCGCNLVVYASNNPEQSGIEVVVPDSKQAAKAS